MLRVFAFGLWNLVRVPFYPLWWAARRLRGRRTRWLRLDVRPQLVEVAGRRARLLARLALFRERVPTSLESLRRLARTAAADPDLTGVVVVLPPLRAGWAMAEGLRAVLDRLREDGKEVLVWLPEGAGNKELFVASAASRVAAPPQASLAPLGLVAESRYYRGLLEQLGVRLEPFARREYKTALEGLSAEGMSPAQREQVDALLATIDTRLREGLAARLGGGDVDVDVLFEKALIRGTEAQELGLVDDLAHEDALPALVGETKLLSAGTYLALREASFFRPLRRRRFVGVVEVRGPIGDKRRADAVVGALRSARQNTRCAGVVLHVDSPGGSAAVSDRIHREVSRLREEKPVVAAFGDVAASGGYYVAAGADRIVAQPTTITGSIGVVAARLVASELLERLGVRTETVRRAPHGDLGSPARPLGDAERAIFDRELDGFYADFVALVADGRGRPVEDIEPLARGRVWSGADAEARGLVDALGGHDAAVEALAELRPEVRTLESRLLEPRQRLPPPPAEAAAAALGTLAPDLALALRLVRGGERVLLWAPGLPEVR
ncbi:MAG: signal peptide peptidase SppA [Myxococcota bacterium]